MELLTDANTPHAFKVGEIFVLKGLGESNVDFILFTLQYWAEKKVSTYAYLHIRVGICSIGICTQNCYLEQIVRKNLKKGPRRRKRKLALCQHYLAINSSMSFSCLN